MAVVILGLRGFSFQLSALSSQLSASLLQRLDASIFLKVLIAVEG
jgi:hypothetical protein